MSRPVWALAILLALAPLLAGCLNGAGNDAWADPRKRDLDALDLVDEVTPVAGDRGVRATVMMHEKLDPAAADLPFTDAQDSWQPRDVALTDHGVQEVYDEFGRAVPAFVFRFSEMVYVIDDISFDFSCSGDDCVDIDGHYEEHLYEYAFDRATGRMMGVSDLEEGWHAFAHPDSRHPYSSLTVMFMVLKVLDGDLGREIFITEYAGHKLYYHFEPFDEFRPKDGDCAMWELIGRWDPPWDELTPDVVVPGKEYHTVICLEPGELIPLWSWAGNQMDGGYHLERLNSSFPLADFGGEELPPVTYTPMPWQPVRGILPVPGPLLMPPTDVGGTWAQALQERAKALYLSPTYLAYRLKSEQPYAQLAYSGLKELNLLEVLNITVPQVVPMLETMTLFMITDAKTRHMHVVHSRDGGPEQPDLHIADPTGTDFPEYFPAKTADQLPLLVSDALMEGQLGALVPIDPNMLVFWYLNYADWPGDPIAIWDIVRDCTETLDGQTLVVEGVRGYAQAVSVTPAGDPECSADGAAAQSAMDQRMALRRATAAGTVPRGLQGLEGIAMGPSHRGIAPMAQPV